MITTGALKGAIQAKFEGGTSLTLNWYRIIREGAQAMLQNIAPKPLYREQAIYGGAIDGITMYYCPAEVAAPKGIYDRNDKLIKYSYVAANIFDYMVSNGTSELIFTIAYKNGCRFLIMNTQAGSALYTVDSMNNPSDLTADMALTLNTYDYLTSGGAIQATFTDTLTKIGKTFATAQDLSDYLFGTVLIPLDTLEPRKIASIDFRLKTDSMNYWSISGTNALANLIEGWNTVRMNMVERVATGTPVATNINSWELEVTMNTGETSTIIVDRISIAKTALYNLGYTSGLVFVDKDDRARKVEPDDDADLIDITDEEVEILKYECCLIAEQEATTRVARSEDRDDFVTVLGRKYSLYWSKNPSDEKPISYNQSPEIDHGIFLGNISSRLG